MKCKYLGELSRPAQVSFKIGDNTHHQTMSGVYTFNTLKKAEEFQKVIFNETGVAVIITKQQ